MKGRDLFAVLGGAVVALRASVARSVEPVRVGFVSGGDAKGAAAFVAALRDGLAGEGYHEPDTLILECLYADYIHSSTFCSSSRSSSGGVSS